MDQRAQDLRFSRSVRSIFPNGKPIERTEKAMKFHELGEQVRNGAEMYTKKGCYLGFCLGVNSVAVLESKKHPYKMDDIINAEVLELTKDADGDRAIVLDLA